MKQAFAAEFNGGPLGGTSSFSKYTAEMRTASTLARFGTSLGSSQPLILTFSSKLSTTFAPMR